MVIISDVPIFRIFTGSFYLNGTSVIVGQWGSGYEGLCAIKRRLDLNRISASAGFE